MLGERLVVGDLEAERHVARDQVALHRDRSLLAAESEQLETNLGVKPPAHLAKELGMGGIRRHRGSRASLPTQAFELEEEVVCGGIGAPVLDPDRTELFAE